MHKVGFEPRMPVC